MSGDSGGTHSHDGGKLHVVADQRKVLRALHQGHEGHRLRRYQRRIHIRRDVPQCTSQPRRGTRPESRSSAGVSSAGGNERRTSRILFVPAPSAVAQNTSIEGSKLENSRCSHAKTFRQLSLYATCSSAVNRISAASGQGLFPLTQLLSVRLRRLALLGESNLVGQLDPGLVRLGAELLE